MRRVRRTPIVLLVGALVVAAIAFSARDDADSISDTQPVVPVAAVSALPAADALSASWYCAEGTSNAGGRADETIVVSSAADTPITAIVTVMPGGTTSPSSRTLEVAPHREVRLPVSQVLATADPGVVVEIEGGQAAVAHEVRNGADFAAEPCARRASPDWYFAAGTTVRGTQQYLVLFDPFGDDAIVDVRFLTGSGVQEPDQLQGLVVSRGSRVAIPVHELVPREQVVAAEVHARTGRVVAERSMIFDGTVPDDAPARRGIALSLGAVAPARAWELPFGTTADGGSSTVGVANFGDAPATTELDVLIDGGEQVARVPVSVPPRTAVTVDVGAHAPPGSDFAVRASTRPSSDRRARIVVEALSWWPDASSSTAVASSLGMPLAARRWVVPLPAVDAGGTVTVVNPGAGPVTAELRVFGADGRAPVSAPAAAIAPGHDASFDLGALTTGQPRVLVVVADADVVVGLTLRGADGVAFAAAVPDFAATAG